jgi:hypothetical protein
MKLKEFFIPALMSQIKNNLMMRKSGKLRSNSNKKLMTDLILSVYWTRELEHKLSTL